MGWESCVSPGQNFLASLIDEELAAEISVAMALVPGMAQLQPPAQGGTQGRAQGSSTKELCKFKQLEDASFLHCHIPKEPCTPR